MAVGGVLATQLNTATARAFGIFIDGFDVSKEPATPARYGVPRDSIEVTETGRWGVSSMTFDIDDTALQVSVTDGMEVRFEIFATGGTAGMAFRGWVSRYTVRPAFGEQGRTISIEATGTEALLDWAIIPTDMTFVAAGNILGSYIQSLVANAIGTGPLFAISGGNSQSTVDQGITQLVRDLTLIDAVTVTAGTTLGQGIAQLAASSNYAILSNFVAFTVDFDFSLRVYQLSQTAGVISQFRNDASLITLTDTPAGPIQAEGLTYDVTAANNRGVFIKGANAAGTGTLMDGSGKIGPIGYVQDDTSDSAASLASIGADYLARATTGLNGHFMQTNIVSLTFVRPDGTLTVTDARVGLSAAQYYIGPITRHFPGSNLHDLAVSFGGPPPSGAALLRQLTSTTRP